MYLPLAKGLSFLGLASVLAVGCLSGSEPVDGAGGTGGMGGAAGTSAGVGGKAAAGGNTGKGGGAGTSGKGGQGGSSGGKAGSAGSSGSAGLSGASGSSGSGGSASVNCPGDPNTLKAAAACRGRLFGVALAQQHLNDSQYVAAAREYDYVTAENEMKWDTLQPQQNQFNYGNADRIMDFAEQNGMKVKGHTLVWYSQLPQWVTNLNNPDSVRSTMLNHINQVMARYKGRIHVWDVVNEAWNDDGGSLRNNVFHQHLGEGYIDEAFVAARAADPAAKLYYNDYGIEGMSAKANATYEMLEGLLARGVPVDGVGLQMHTRNGNGAPRVDEFRENLTRLAALGLEIAIAEMDVVTCGSDPLSERLETQRGRYHDLIEVCLQEPACNAITIWGISDRHSWLNNAGSATTGCEGGEPPRGLLLDDNYQKKPAYTGVMDALLGR